MSGKENLYELGDHGVDLVSTPIHRHKDSWDKLQNAEFSNVQGQGGVKKRGGLGKLNTVALNSGASIQAMFNMPLETAVFDDPGSIIFSLITPNAGVFWRESDDGVTFADVAAMTTDTAPLPGAYGRRVHVTLDGVLYWLRTNSLYSWDGVTKTQEIPSFPVDPDDATSPATTTSLEEMNGTLYFCVKYGGGNLRVYSWVPGSGTSVTAAIGGILSTASDAVLATGLGYLWALDIATNPAKARRIDPDVDPAWTLDETFAGTAPIGTTIIGYNDNLYASTYDLTDVNAKIWRCTTPGTWTAVQTFAGSTAVQTGIVTFIPDEDSTTLIGIFVGDSGGGTTDEMQAWQSDVGTSWSTSGGDDFVAQFGVDPTQVVPGEGCVFDGDVWCTIADFNENGIGLLVQRIGASLWQEVEPSTFTGQVIGVVGNT